jgi:hypothetical protein
MSQPGGPRPASKGGQAGGPQSWGGGQGGSELLVDKLGGNIQQASEVDTRQGEDLLEQAGKVLVEGGNVLRIEASPKVWKKVAKAETYPVGNVAGRPPPPPDGGRPVWPAGPQHKPV